MAEEGADFNHRSFRGRNAIHRVAIKGDLQTMKFLLTQDINLDLVDKSGRSALYFACINRHEDIVDILVENGATMLPGDTNFLANLFC